MLAIVNITTMWTIVNTAVINLGAVWFAARDTEPTHAVLHAVLGAAFLWWAAHLAARRRDVALPVQHLDERLTRIDQAIDAVAVEVERISEGQRFTTKILAERARESATLPPVSKQHG